MEWISLEKKCPQANTWVIVFGKNCFSFACMYFEEGGDYIWRFHQSNWNFSMIPKEDMMDYIKNDVCRAISYGINNSLEANEITHWMPLPLPPKDDE